MSDFTARDDNFHFAEMGDRWSLQLAEGGRWRTTEPWTNAEPKSGMTVEIRRGALGSYILRAKGQTTVRVTRVN